MQKWLIKAWSLDLHLIHLVNEYGLIILLGLQERSLLFHSWYLRILPSNLILPDHLYIVSAGGGTASSYLEASSSLNLTFLMRHSREYHIISLWRDPLMSVPDHLRLWLNLVHFNITQLAAQLNCIDTSSRGNIRWLAQVAQHISSWRKHLFFLKVLLAPLLYLSRSLILIYLWPPRIIWLLGILGSHLVAYYEIPKSLVLIHSSVLLRWPHLVLWPNLPSGSILWALIDALKVILPHSIQVLDKHWVIFYFELELQAQLLILSSQPLAIICILPELLVFES